MLRTLSGLFLVGALNRLRKRKRTNRENPRTIPAQIEKIPEKLGKSEKGQKRTKKEGQVQIGKPPRLKPPRLAALDSEANFRQSQWFPPRFSSTFNPSRPIFCHFQSLQSVSISLTRSKAQEFIDNRMVGKTKRKQL